MWSAERNGDSSSSSSRSSHTYRQLPDGQGDGALVIVRDFAYSRMAAATARNNISTVGAKTFAEYV